MAEARNPAAVGATSPCWRFIAFIRASSPPGLMERLVGRATGKTAKAKNELYLQYSSTYPRISVAPTLMGAVACREKMT